MEKNIKSQLSIIIPVYNEELVVEKVVSEVLKYCRDSEIIVIDDGSTDNTTNIIKEFNNIKIIRHKENKGYGATLKTGIETATKDIIVIIDGDGSYFAKDIGLLIPNIEKFDMIVGARIKEVAREFPLYQKITKGFICSLLGAIFKQRILDINSGLRLIKRHIVEKYLSVLPDGFSFTSSITLAMLLDNRKIKYVPISYSNRTGESKVKLFNYTLNFIASYGRIIYCYIKNRNV